MYSPMLRDTVRFCTPCNLVLLHRAHRKFTCMIFYRPLGLRQLVIRSQITSFQYNHKYAQGKMSALLKLRCLSIFFSFHLINMEKKSKKTNSNRTRANSSTIPRLKPWKMYIKYKISPSPNKPILFLLPEIFSCRPASLYHTNKTFLCHIKPGR